MSRPETIPAIDQEASAVLIERLQGVWTAEKQSTLEARLSQDQAFAQAYARSCSAWDALDALGQSPEIMRHREAALANVRRTAARRWSLPTTAVRARRRSLAVAAGLVIALVGAWQLSPYGYVPGQYRTSLGEHMTVELEDHSRIALDSDTQLRVRYSPDARLIQLRQGQAKFSVAHDPTRPFKVIAGDREIVAVGTVFTVDYADREVRVALIQGRVAVIRQDSPIIDPIAFRQGDARPQGKARVITLNAGEELRAVQGGEATVVPHADLDAATAWLQSKIILRTESLGEAVRRINRYSRVQIEIADTGLASKKISGVFDAGDAQGFIDAVERYLPVEADPAGSDKIVLRAR